MDGCWVSVVDVDEEEEEDVWDGARCLLKLEAMMVSCRRVTGFGAIIIATDRRFGFY